MAESTLLVAELLIQARLSQQSHSAEFVRYHSARGKVEPRQYTTAVPVHAVPPNPSIEGTASGLRPPAAPHVTR